MEQEITPGIYQHYKGKLYRVLGVGHHSESLEKMVVYQAQYTSPDFGEGALWIRPLTLFLQTVEVDGKHVPRFQRVAEE